MAIVISCAHLECPHAAILSIKTPTGWANLCRNHYELRISTEAREYCQARGLDTREKKLAFIRERLGDLGKVRHPRRWAYEIMEKHARGEFLYPMQLELARRAAAQWERAPGEDDQ